MLKEVFKSMSIYHFTILVLVLTFTLFFIDSQSNYDAMVELNESYTQLLDEQRKNSDELQHNWESNYNDLQDKYERVVAENIKLQEQMHEVDIPEYDFTEAEIYLIAQCAEAEAGVKNYKSQQYVTQVILNRLHSGSFPQSVEEVIYQKVDDIPQFSVAYDGKIEREVTPETLANVYEVIVHGTDLPENVLYFYSACVKENWVNNLNTFATVERTVFAYD